MPGPYDKFQEAFETFQEQLKELLTTQHAELLEAIRSVPLPSPTPQPDPLAFYETILRIESQPNYSAELPPVNPYFADVHDTVVRYFGGHDTTNPLGKKFLAETLKRFAYLKD